MLWHHCTSVSSYERTCASNGMMSRQFSLLLAGLVSTHPLPTPSSCVRRGSDHSCTTAPMPPPHRVAPSTLPPLFICLDIIFFFLERERKRERTRTLGYSFATLWFMNCTCICYCFIFHHPYFCVLSGFLSKHHAQRTQTPCNLSGFLLDIMVFDNTIVRVARELRSGLTNQNNFAPHACGV